MNNYKKRLPLLMTGIFACCSASAEEVEPVTLKFAEWLPTTSFATEHGANPFMEKVAELSNGNIQFDFYPAEQLGRGSESLTLLQTGVADIANVAPAYMPEKLPLSGVVELPEIVKNSCSAADSFYELAQPGGTIYEAEFKRHGIRPLWVGNMGRYRILTNNKDIASLDDLNGLRIRTAGGPMTLTADALGSSPVTMQGSDVLTSLSRGTLDGVYYPLRGILDYGLAPALDQLVPNLSVGSFGLTYSISDRVWESLSEQQQDILLEAGRYAMQTYCDYVDSSEPEIIQVLENEYDITQAPFSDSDLEQAQTDLEEVYARWAEPLEARGLPAQQVIEEMQ
ncbi:TRAP transporter substrate-binding protein DctP [Halomonas sp. HMF6819]|uniref:TRAP transporter substrate-binding protein DctP n=1 Tax=Halomonas sp. HMF6819 TaxID=3373085 RepID=UPI0037A916B8